MDIIDGMTMERDKLELALGDTLDVKAGIILAAIAVLGTLTATLLASPTLMRELRIWQMVSLFFLAIAGLFAVLTMIPRNYLLPDTPDKYGAWFEQLREYYVNSPEQVAQQAMQAIIKSAAERISTNHDINVVKSRYLFITFWLTVTALGIDLVTLSVMGLSILLS